MYQKIIICGNLTHDPELRYTASGTAVANLNIAVNERIPAGNGEYKDHATFFDTVVWGKQAEACSQYLSKGRQVLVEGRMEKKEWESDGQKRHKMQIVAKDVKFLGSKKDEKPPEEISDIEPF
jgi:single-strand DNA-binding protein